MNGGKKKNAFAVRCHRFGERERELYAYAEKYFGSKHTYLLMNVEKAPSVPKDFQCIVFNREKVLSAKEFLWFPEVAWKCGDYCYYAANRVLKGYEYLWLAEPDLKICDSDPENFFSFFEKSEHDFLAPFLGPASDKLYFYHTAKSLDAAPMSCLFPISRIKSEKIAALEGVRKKLTKDFITSNKPAHDYPNDEIFCATVSRRLGFSCAPLDKVSSFNFMMFRSDKETMFLENDVQNVEGKFVLHPVLEEEEFFLKKQRIFSTVLRNSRELVNWVGETIGRQSDGRIRKELQKRLLSELRKFLQIDK